MPTTVGQKQSSIFRVEGCHEKIDTDQEVHLQGRSIVERIITTESVYMEYGARVLQSLRTGGSLYVHRSPDSDCQYEVAKNVYSFVFDEKVLIIKNMHVKGTFYVPYGCHKVQLINSTIYRLEFLDHGSIEMSRNSTVEKTHGVVSKKIIPLRSN